MYFFENFILFYLCSKCIYEGFFEFLLVILWLMFIGISFAGCRDDYRDKEQFDPEGEVDSTPERLMFIGISFAGCRDDYRDKEQFDPEGEVDSTPETRLIKL